MTQANISPEIANTKVRVRKTETCGINPTIFYTDHIISTVGYLRNDAMGR
jgi:hypothetical protein